MSEKQLFLAGTQQLQNAVLDMIRRMHAKPEPVKPGVTSFPVLPEPQSHEEYLLYQDWLVVVSGLVGDVSDSAAEWWSSVLKASGSRLQSLGFVIPYR